MRYVKPSVARLGPASSAIQGIGTKGLMSLDANVSKRPATSTGSAYDLDE
jgi:hypothetical protein